MDYDKQETIVDAINGVDKLFLLTLPTPNMTEIASSLIKEAKKNDVKYIVKLSVMGADAEPGKCHPGHSTAGATRAGLTG